jgi:hypothetical protein
MRRVQNGAMQEVSDTELFSWIFDGISDWVVKYCLLGWGFIQGGEDFGIWGLGPSALRIDCRVFALCLLRLGGLDQPRTKIPE